MSNNLDQAALRSAASEELEPIPDWLSANKFVYSYQHSCNVKVLSIVGKLAKVETFGKATEVPVESLQKPQVDEIQNDLAKITEPSYQAITTEVVSQLNAVKILPGQEATKLPLPEELCPALREAIKKIGITEFYSHQIKAFRELNQGKSLTIVTPTASGKSMCFLPQAFQIALTKKQTTLLLYPLRALASDQLRKLDELNEALPSSSRLLIVQCTGDVPLEKRKSYFTGTSRPDIVIASPDVLHHQLYNTKKSNMRLWREYLSQLGLIVCDESHSYISSFGIHFANLMRRLRLAIENAGGSTKKNSWVISTATISNPLELASQFTGLDTKDLTLIDKSGAALYKRTLLVFKPQSASNFVTTSLIQTLLASGLKGLVFVNSRATGKQIISLLSYQSGGKVAGVDIFHGSLRTSHRQDLIERLSSGELRILITTSALEAGIDLPDLDFALLRGATSLNSFWQRAGRAGRRSPGLLLFVPDETNHLDYYYATKPERLFAPVEKIKIQPDYPSILAKHLMCGGAEGGIPVQSLRAKVFGQKAEPMAAELVRQRQLQWSGNGILWKEGYPHKDISMRGIVNDTFELVDCSTGEVLEEMTLDLLHRECHEGAIYLTCSQGETIPWRCISVDMDSKKAMLECTQLKDRRTRPNSNPEVDLISALETPKVIPTAVESGSLRCSFWWGKISERVEGYKELELTYAPVCTNSPCAYYRQSQPEGSKICRGCQQTLSDRLVSREIEDVNFETALETSFEAPVLRLEVNQALARAITLHAENLRQELLEQYGDPDNVPSSLFPLFESEAVYLCLHSLTHLVAKAIPLLFLASDKDISSLTVERPVEKGNAHKSVAYIYDRVHEGCGTTEALFEDWYQCVAKAIEIATECDCGINGCPKCLIEYGCPQSNEVLCKPLGEWLLKQIYEM